MPGHWFKRRSPAGKGVHDKTRTGPGERNDGPAGDQAGGIFTGPAKNLRTVAEYRNVLYFVREDGTVLPVDTKPGPCEHCAQDWKDIVGIASPGDYLAGLRRDGTVVIESYWTSPERTYKEIAEAPVCSDVRKAIKETKRWRNIIAIDACLHGLFGLKQDGRLVYVGVFSKDEARQMDKWEDLIQIAAQGELFGLKRDGTVVTLDEFVDYETGSWTGITSIAAGITLVAGIREDGQAMYTVPDVDLSGWNNMVRLAVSEYTLAGLDGDGNIRQIGIDSRHREIHDLSGWKDMVFLDAVGFHDFVGIQRDGTILSTFPDMEPANIND